MAAEDLPPDDPTAIATPANDDDDDDDDDLFGTNDDDEAPRPISDDGAVGGRTGDDGGHAPVSTRRMLEARPPPPPLPAGWFLRTSRSFPSDVYYFNHDTGECRWDHPVGAAVGTAAASSSPAVSRASLDATAAAAAAAVKSILKRSGSAASDDGGGGAGGGDSHRKKPSPSPRKRTKTADGGSGERERHHRRERERGGGRRPSSSASSSTGGEPREVRVLHILKKHRGSRRPASWRSPNITDSKEKAVADLRELISILESAGGESDPKELRATFEELARTESDCSSAKRGGDLGFFGRKKMQPAFEKASFGLKPGQLSDIVDTSSGVHVILRIA